MLNEVALTGVVLTGVVLMAFVLTGFVLTRVVGVVLAGVVLTSVVHLFLTRTTERTFAADGPRSSRTRLFLVSPLFPLHLLLLSEYTMLLPLLDFMLQLLLLLVSIITTMTLLCYCSC